jgi:hypothetical protein
MNDKITYDWRKDDDLRDDDIDAFCVRCVN